MKAFFLCFLFCSLSFAQTVPKVNQTPTKKELEEVRSPELTPEERAILARGEISTTRYVVGGILATYPLGFGIGHAVQGRYTERGWIFTAGELGSLMVMVSGIGSCLRNSYSSNDDRYTCDRNGLLTLGAAGFVGFRIWEIIDAWAIPPQINRRYRNLKTRLGESTETVKFEPLVIPKMDGGQLGLRISF